MDLKTEQLVAFCVLMENDIGIVGKAPSYLWEKYEACQRRTSRNELMGLLDLNNQAKYKKYIEMWRLDD